MGVGVIAVFHERRVLPLMRHAHRLDEMVLNMPLEQIVLMMGRLDQEEIKKRIKSALGSVPPDAVLDAHPPMHPDDDFIEMVSTLHSSSPPPFPWPIYVPSCLTWGLGGCKRNVCLVPDFNTTLPEDAVQRARNRAHTEGVKM
jgi:hypothetical protein